MSPTKGLPPQLAQPDPDATGGCAQARGVTVLADPAADLHPTRLEVAGSDGVFVGRIRADLADPHAVLFGSVADAQGRGLNAIQIAEFLLRESLD